MLWPFLTTVTFQNENGGRLPQIATTPDLS
jgi:hypothetical protein